MGAVEWATSRPTCANWTSPTLIPEGAPPKTAAFSEIVNVNRAPEDAEMADALDVLNRPAIVTLARVISLAGPGFADWLRDRKNARRIPHRLEACGYVAVRNPNDIEGRWKIDGRRHTLYGRAALFREGPATGGIRPERRAMTPTTQACREMWGNLVPRGEE